MSKIIADIMVLPCIVGITNQDEYDKLKKPLREKESAAIHDLLLSDVFVNAKKEKINLISLFQLYQAEDFINRNIEDDVLTYTLMW